MGKEARKGGKAKRPGERKDGFFKTCGNSNSIQSTVVIRNDGETLSKPGHAQRGERKKTRGGRARAAQRGRKMKGKVTCRD